MNASGTGRRGQHGPNANQNIQVYVRVRPTNIREKTIRSQEVIEVPKPEAKSAISRQVIARQLLDSSSQKKFTFDRAFGTDSTQKEVYETVVKPLIEEVLAGYNCTVFAYGQTGTGKTFTMVGEEAPELGLSWEDDGPIGIIPRALSHLFDELRAMDMEFSMRVSYLELYNEELCDLLSTDDSVKIRIYDDSTKKGSVIVQGLEEIPVHNKDDVYKLLAKGQERRRTASTLMNAQSSRSHTVFSILVHIRENGIDGEEMLKIGKLNLVDLAGSENISKAGNEKGIRTRETVNINQSLLTLGRVITALVEKTPHIPYRESKLTRLLQESLGGRTKTSIIATISPGHKDLEETLSTLDYAHRAKNIQNRPEINQRLTKKTVLKEYTEEIDRLKRDLMAARDKNGVYLAHETYEDMVFKIENSNKELTDKHDKIKALKEELSRQMTLFEEISLNLIERSEQLARTDEKLRVTETALELKRRNLKKAKKCYEEKKALLSQHIRTEEILTEQARDLIATAETASTDTHKLHESIDRHKAVESAVESSCEKFTHRLQSDLSQANETLSKFHENFESTSKKIATAIQTFSNEQTNLSSNLLSLLQAVDKMGNDHSAALKNQLESTESKFNENTATCTRETSKFQSDLVTFTKTSNSSFQDLVLRGFESFQAQLNAISATQKQIIDSVRIRDQEFQTFTAALEQQLSAITVQTHEIETEHQNLMKCQTLFTELSARMGTHLTSIHTHTNKITTTVENSTHTMNTFKDTSFITDQNTFHGKMETLMQDVRKDIEENSSEIVVAADSIREDIEKRVAGYTKTHSQLLSIDLARNLKENHEKVAMLDKASNAALHEKYMELNAEVDRVSLSSKNHAGHNEILLKTTRKLTDTVATELKGQMRKISDATEYFRREEVKTYQPTGETPARKEYKIERDLAQTLPHERIIRKFRLERNVDLDSSTFSEADEDCSMLSETQTDNACILINSTPFKDGVTERKNLSEPHLSQILTLSAISEEDKENFETH